MRTLLNPPRRALSLGVAILALLGCAGPATSAQEPRIPPILRDYAAAVHRLGLDRHDAPVVVIAPPTDGTGKVVGAGMFHRSRGGRFAGRWEIRLDPRIQSSHRLAQAVLAHELAHYLLRHLDGRCAGRVEHCEMEAHFSSVEVLERGFAVPHRDAVLDVYTFLDMAARLHARGRAQVTPGHRTPCEEFKDFAQYFGLPGECRRDLPEEG